MEVFSPDYGLVSTFNENWYAGVPRVFNPQDGTLGVPLPVPDSGGGIAMADGKLYIGVRDINNPGLYIVDATTNMPVGNVHPTSLQPYSLLYFEETPATEVTKSEKIPEALAVEAVYPNPFNPVTTITFSLGLDNTVTVDVFNIAGQKVDTLLNSFMIAGTHSIFWNAAHLTSGVYHIRVSDGISSQTAKVTLVK